MKHKSGLELFFRGALGGVVANFIKALFAWLLFALILRSRFGYFGNTGTFLLLAILGIPAAAVIGGVIGVIIDLISMLRKQDIGVVGRAIIGTGITGLLILAIILYDKLNPVTNRWSADNKSSWMIASLFYLDYGIIIGAIAGIVVGSQKRSTGDQEQGGL